MTERLKREIAVETLQKILVCDFRTGKLIWANRPKEMFSMGHYNSQQQNCSIWNSRFSGKPAFTTQSSHGYLCGTLFSIKYRAHRVIWALHAGAWSIDDIDHINGNRSDNRIVNLREATRSQNLMNSCVRSNNTSGLKGVSWAKERQKWNAYINANGIRKNLGYFETAELAYAYYCAAAVDAHGDFRRL